MEATNAQRLLEADLDQPEFRIGIEENRWSLAEPVSEEQWPIVFTWISAAMRENGPERWLVRWDVADYNSQRPTGAFWDSEKKDFLDKAAWPKAVSGSVAAAVFKVDGWAHPGQGFYHPYDRLAWKNHEAKWAQENPQYLWTTENTLTDFITLIYRWLNCEAYLGN